MIFSCLVFFFGLVVVKMKAEVVSLPEGDQRKEIIYLPNIGRSTCLLQGHMLTSCTPENDMAIAPAQTQTQQKDNSVNNGQPKLDLSVILAKGKVLSSEPSTDDECTFDWDHTRTCAPQCWCLFISPYGLGCVRPRGCFFTEKKGIDYVDKPFILIPPS